MNMTLGKIKNDPKFILSQSDIERLIEMAYHNGSVRQNMFGEWPEQKYTMEEIRNHIIEDKKYQPWWLKLLNWLKL
jgi:hypothetical protein